MEIWKKWHLCKPNNGRINKYLTIIVLLFWKMFMHHIIVIVKGLFKALTNFTVHLILLPRYPYTLTTELHYLKQRNQVEMLK